MVLKIITKSKQKDEEQLKFSSLDQSFFYI